MPPPLNHLFTTTAPHLFNLFNNVTIVTKLGKPFRDSVSRGLALIPSAKKMGGMGTEIDVPINFKDAAFVRSHFDAMAVRVDDALRQMKSW